jgi:hypothetical protein
MQRDRSRRRVRRCRSRTAGSHHVAAGHSADRSDGYVVAACWAEPSEEANTRGVRAYTRAGSRSHRLPPARSRRLPLVADFPGRPSCVVAVGWRRGHDLEEYQRCTRCSGLPGAQAPAAVPRLGSSCMGATPPVPPRGTLHRSPGPLCLALPPSCTRSAGDALAGEGRSATGCILDIPLLVFKSLVFRAGSSHRMQACRLATEPIRTSPRYFAPYASATGALRRR